MSFKDLFLKCLPTVAAVGGIFLSVPAQGAVTDNSEPLKYRTEADDPTGIVAASLRDGSLVRFTPYGEDKPLYRANEDYYDKFSYTWTDAEGVTRTSKITEVASEANQIVALLREIYTNPNIPGFVEDVTFEIGADGRYNYDWYSGQADKRDNGNAILPDGYYMVTTHDVSGKYDDNHVAMSRKEYTTIQYPPQDFFPYYIKEAPERPLAGSTALLVELKKEYYREGNGGINLPSITESDTDFDITARTALNYIEAVTLMTKQRYVDGDPANKVDPGFLFNIEGNFAKIFVIAKGSSRPDKASPFKTKYSDTGNGPVIRDGEEVWYREGHIFYDMFEEFSPNNTHPVGGMYHDMESGKKFPVDHNCSSVISQRHDVVMGTSETIETAAQKYHANFMAFIPDNRFAGTTVYDTSSANPVNYAPYTYYAKDHMPYFFFNVITAAVDGNVDIKTEYDNHKALVPLTWTSNYNEIIGRAVPEAFWIYRVVDGSIEPTPIPLSEIIIRNQQNDEYGPFLPEEIDFNAPHLGIYTWMYETDGSLVRSFDGTVTVWIREDYTEETDQGRNVSYVVRGRRFQSNFNHVQSNVVNAVLPYTAGGFLTIELNRAKSTYDIMAKENVYENTIDCKFIKDEANENNLIGNLSVGELLKYKPDDEKGLADAMVKGTFHIIRTWSDGENVHNDIIYELPFNEDNIITSNSTGKNNMVFAIAEPRILEKAQNLEDRCEPFRNLTALQEEGNVFGEKVKVAFALKRNLTQMVSADGKADDMSFPWQPIGKNEDLQLMGYFIDDCDPETHEPFKVSTVNNRIPSSYTYKITFTPSEEGNSEVRISNDVPVWVPVRNLYVGYKGYTFDEISEEIDVIFASDADMYAEGNLRPGNPQAVAVRVQDNSLVKNYDIIQLDHNPLAREISSANQIVARAWRNDNGSFEARTLNNGEYKVAYVTVENYLGKVPIELQKKVNVDQEFALVINTIDDARSPYRKNTYGADFARMPDYPALDIVRANIENKGNGNYDATVSVQPVMDETAYTVAGYGLWSYEHPTYPNPGTYYPVGAVFTNRIHEIANPDATTMRKVAALDPSELNYSFTHSVTTPSNANPVVTTNVVRLYAKVNNPSSCITLDYNQDTNGDDCYLVVDQPVHYGMFGKGTTDVDDIAADGNENYLYFNLQGMPVPADALTPGLYVRTDGKSTEKVVIK